MPQRAALAEDLRRLLAGPSDRGRRARCSRAAGAMGPPKPCRGWARRAGLPAAGDSRGRGIDAGLQINKRADAEFLAQPCERVCGQRQVAGKRKRRWKRPIYATTSLCGPVGVGGGQRAIVPRFARCSASTRAPGGGPAQASNGGTGGAASARNPRARRAIERPGARHSPFEPRRQPNRRREASTATVRVWNAKTGESLLRARWPRYRPFRGLFTATAPQVAAACDDGIIRSGTRRTAHLLHDAEGPRGRRLECGLFAPTESDSRRPEPTPRPDLGC